MFKLTRINKFKLFLKKMDEKYNNVIDRFIKMRSSDKKLTLTVEIDKFNQLLLLIKELRTHQNF